MTIAVIAANGRTGCAFVRIALLAGHTVRAGVHGKSNLMPHDNLTILECDATNSDDVVNLLNGANVVASFIGHTKKSPEYVQSDAMQTLIEACKRTGIDRIISLTGTGVRQAGDTIPFIDRVLNIAVSLVDPKRVRDGIRHAEILEKSKLDWTILRVLKLQNIAPRPFRLSPHGPTKLVVGREDVARAALQVIEKRLFVRQMPILS